MSDVSQPATVAPQPATHVRWLIFALACATSAILYLHRLSWGVVRVQFKADLGFNDVQMGALDAWFSAGYSAGQIPTGWLGDRLGPRRVLATISLAWSAALAIIAVARGMLGLINARLLFGVAQAGGYPNLAKITRNWFPASQRTTVQGFVAASGRVGGVLAPLLVANLMMSAWGLDWRTSLLLLSILGVALSVAIAVVLRNTPAEHPLTNEAERNVAPAAPPVVAGGPKPKLIASWGNALSFGMFLLHSFTAAFADLMFVNWISQYLIDAKGMSLAQMGAFATLPHIGGAFGGVTGGFLNDFLIRLTGQRRWSRAGVAMSGKLLASLLVALAIFIPDGRIAMVVLLACKFFSDWGQPTQWGTTTDIAGRSSGSVFGVMNTVGSVAGVPAGLTMGYVRHAYGWDGLFWLVSAVFAVSGLCWLWIDCTRPLFNEPEDKLDEFEN